MMSECLRLRAVSRSLFKPTTLLGAMRKLGSILPTHPRTAPRPGPHLLQPRHGLPGR
jgi:hypothetical protein